VKQLFDPPKRSAQWMIDHPDAAHTEDYRLKEPMTETQARQAYREDHNLQRLPNGTVFYPGSTARY
jgi:hypothetical protein